MGSLPRQDVPRDHIAEQFPRVVRISARGLTLAGTLVGGGGLQLP
jgi:hypothetical protein